MWKSHTLNFVLEIVLRYAHDHVCMWTDELNPESVYTPSSRNAKRYTTSLPGEQYEARISKTEITIDLKNVLCSNWKVAMAESSVRGICSGPIFTWQNRIWSHDKRWLYSENRIIVVDRRRRRRRCRFRFRCFRCQSAWENCSLETHSNRTTHLKCFG